MKIGITLPAGISESEQLTAYARLVEDGGFDSLWFLDRLVGRHPKLPGSWGDPFLMMAHAAAVTRRIQLGTKVYVLPYRHPIHTAKLTSTLDRLSSGRLILGVGVGWIPMEFDSLGIPLGRRGRLTDEIIDILQQLWTTDEVDHEGPAFSFRGVTIDPKPCQVGGPPIWYGGGSISADALARNPTLGPRDPSPVLRRIGRVASGWMPQFLHATDDLMRDDWARISEYAVEAGRNPSEIQRVMSVSVYLHDEGDELAAQAEVERVTGGSFEEARKRAIIGTVAEALPALQERLAGGFWTYLVISPLTAAPRQLEFLAERVSPALRVEAAA